MDEGGGGWGQDFSGRSKLASICETASGRLRFRVELRAGETTIVSWKRLLKEANLSEPGGPISEASGSSEAERHNVPQTQSISQSVGPPSRKHTEQEAKDPQAQAGSNRLSTVIERIERMYAGDGSSDEEAGVLDNVPYDDEYDTSDSFIDDVELDDYFQVDNSAIKHEGFFVNRGKLERIEPAISKDQQPKKRRRKSLMKGHGEHDDGFIPNKIAKLGDKDKKYSLSTEASHGVAIPSISGEAVQFRDQKPKKRRRKNLMKDHDGHDDGFTPKKMAKLGDKAGNAAVNLDPFGVFHVVTNRQYKETNQWKPGNVSPANHTCSVDSLSQRSTDKNRRREGSSARPRSMMLDRAIKELEKIVAESRPPSTEVQDPDNSSQAVKKRLPPEIKLKLAKVARLAQQANSGIVPKDMINRLMSIVGHLMQVRTLKRNLKLMAKIGLSAKQEKDDRMQRIKQEIAEMVKLHVSCLNSNVEQHAANLDDTRDDGQEKKDGIRHKYSMNDVLENKICDLYDLYLEGLDEDSRSSARRLYEELTVLWPNGFMDTDGIKRAIRKSKERRGPSSLVKREKIRKRKLLVPKEEEEDPSKAPLLIHSLQKKLSVESSERGFTSSSRPVPVSHLRAHAPAASSNGPRVEKMNLDKAKESPTITPLDTIPKKKVKKKPNVIALEAQQCLDKLTVSPAQEQQEQQK